MRSIRVNVITSHAGFVCAAALENCNQAPQRTHLAESGQDLQLPVQNPDPGPAPGLTAGFGAGPCPGPTGSDLVQYWCLDRYAAGFAAGPNTAKQ